MFSVGAQSALVFKCPHIRKISRNEAGETWVAVSLKSVLAIYMDTNFFSCFGVRKSCSLSRRFRYALYNLCNW
jgi:hypothetical protein